MSDDSSPYYTEHQCTRCGALVHGIAGNWACTLCETVSPYAPPAVPAAIPDRDPAPAPVAE